MLTLRRLPSAIALATAVLAIAMAPVSSTTAHAQSLDLTVGDAGISFGDSRRVVGLRFNFRDRRMEEVIGLNATVWYPYDDAVGGKVRGLALGLPVTGAESIRGIAWGLGGVGAGDELAGIGFGGLGLGAGGTVAGVMFGGLGIGAGGDLRGLMVGGLGAGAGGNAQGAMIGGLAAGVGGSSRGITIGGLAVGAGGNAQGLQLAGLAAGAGGELRGINVAGLAVGAGDAVSGVTVAGLAVGAGNEVRGLTVAGLGIGAGDALRGISLTAGGLGAPLVADLAVGLVGIRAIDVRGAALSAGYVRIGPDGSLRGVSTGLVTEVRGEHRGLTIGLVNIARELHGVQLGLINIAHSNRPGLRVLPVMNADFR